MLEFPEQVRTCGARDQGPPLGHLWVQAWTDNDYLNLKALFDIISSSGRSPEELFLRSGNSPAFVCPSNCPSVNISCYNISSKTTGRIFLNLVRMFPSVPICASTKGPSAMFDFSCYHISSETTCSPQCLVVQVQKKIRSVDKFGRLVPGSNLVKLPIDSLVIASPPRPLVGFFLDLGQNVPLNV